MTTYTHIANFSGGGFLSGTTFSPTTHPVVQLNDILKLTVSWAAATGTCSVADNLGNQYLPGTLAILGNGGAQQQQGFYCVVTHAGTATITATVTASSGGTADIFGVQSRPSAGSSFAVRSSNQAIGNSNAPNSGNMTAVAGDLQYGGVTSFGGGAAGAGGATTANNDQSGGGNWVDAYILASAGGTVSAAFTAVSGNYIATAFIITPSSGAVQNAIFDSMNF